MSTLYNLERPGCVLFSADMVSVDECTKDLVSNHACLTWPPPASIHVDTYILESLTPFFFLFTANMISVDEHSDFKSCSFVLTFQASPAHIFCVDIYNFENLTCLFCIPLSIASLISSVCSMAAFHTAV